MHCSELVATMEETRYFGPAVVLKADASGESVRVRLEEGEGRAVTAIVPVSLPIRPAAGDRVLVAGEPESEVHVLSVLTTTRPAPEAPPALEASSGAKATIDRSTSTETIRVFSGGGRLIFEYEPESGTARLSPETRDLEFAVPGRLRLSAGSRVELAAPEFELNADRGKISIEEMNYEGRRFRAVLERSKVWVGRMETIARTVIGKARNVYRRVEGLHQLRAGRARTLVDSSYHLKADTASLKAKKDFNVDGEQILLG